MRFLSHPIVKIIISATLLILIAIKVDFIDAFARLATLPLWLSAALTGVAFFGLFVQAAKTTILLPEKSVWTLFRIGIISQIYSVVFFGQVAGDVAKAGYLLPSPGGLHRIVAAVLFDKVTGLLALLTLGLLGLCLDARSVDPVVAPTLGLLMVFLLAGICTAIFISEAGAARLFAWLPARIGNHLRHTFQAVRVFSSNPRMLVLSIVIGLVFQSVVIMNCAWLGAGLGIDLSLAAWSVTICTVSLVLLLPISIAGLGLRDITLMGLLSGFGVSTEQALALSFAMLAIQLVMVAVGCLLLLRPSQKRDANP